MKSTIIMSVTVVICAALLATCWHFSSVGRYQIHSAAVDTVSLENGSIMKQSEVFKIDTLTGDTWGIRLYDWQTT